jgi:hypothetical protein
MTEYNKAIAKLDVLIEQFSDPSFLLPDYAKKFSKEILLTEMSLAAWNNLTDNNEPASFIRSVNDIYTTENQTLLDHYAHLQPKKFWQQYAEHNPSEFGKNINDRSLERLLNHLQRKLKISSSDIKRTLQRIAGKKNKNQAFAYNRPGTYLSLWSDDIDTMPRELLYKSRNLSYPIGCYTNFEEASERNKRKSINQRSRLIASALFLAEKWYRPENHVYSDTPNSEEIDLTRETVVAPALMHFFIPFTLPLMLDYIEETHPKLRLFHPPESVSGKVGTSVFHSPTDFYQKWFKEGFILICVAAIPLYLVARTYFALPTIIVILCAYMAVHNHSISTHDLDSFILEDLESTVKDDLKCILIEMKNVVESSKQGTIQAGEVKRRKTLEKSKLLSKSSASHIEYVSPNTVKYATKNRKACFTDNEDQKTKAQTQIDNNAAEGRRKQAKTINWEATPSVKLPPADWRLASSSSYFETYNQQEYNKVNMIFWYKPDCHKICGLHVYFQNIFLRLLANARIGHNSLQYVQSKNGGEFKLRHHNRLLSHCRLWFKHAASAEVNDQKVALYTPYKMTND